MENCLIVGGGLIGLLTAKELVEAGIKVTLVEKGAVGQESSWAGGGILSPLYPWRYDDAITYLSLWSQGYYPLLCQQLLDETGIDPELTVSGLLMLDVDDLDAAIAWAGRFGYSIEMFPAQEAMDEEFRTGVAVKVTLRMPTVAQVRNPRMLAALKKWLELKKVNIIEHQPVTSLLVEESQVCGVQLGERTLLSKHVIVASGAWSSVLLGTANVDLNIFPVQGQMLLFKAEPGLIKHIVMRDGLYLIPRQDGHILAGSTVEYRGFDKQTTNHAYSQLRSSALLLVPQLADYPIVKHWAGLRPGSERGIPYIGAVQGVAGLYVNCGHFRNGVVMGPASARLLVDIMMQRQQILDPKFYQP